MYLIRRWHIHPNATWIYSQFGVAWKFFTIKYRWWQIEISSTKLRCTLSGVKCQQIFELISSTVHSFSFLFHTVDFAREWDVLHVVRTYNRQNIFGLLPSGSGPTPYHMIHTILTLILNRKIIIYLICTLYAGNYHTDADNTVFISWFSIKTDLFMLAQWERIQFRYMEDE